jgi:hypothetical protein
MSSFAIGQRWATSVDDSTQFINEGCISDVSSVGKSLQFLHVIEIVFIVGWICLNFLGPIEESSNPLKIRMLSTVTDFVWRFAEVDVWEQGGATFPLCSCAGVVI